MKKFIFSKVEGLEPTILLKPSFFMGIFQGFYSNFYLATFRTAIFKNTFFSRTFPVAASQAGSVYKYDCCIMNLVKLKCIKKAPLIVNLIGFRFDYWYIQTCKSMTFLARRTTL